MKKGRNLEEIHKVEEMFINKKSVIKKKKK